MMDKDERAVRDTAILEAVEGGKTHASVARKYKLSASRVCQIVATMQRRRWVRKILGRS